MCVISNRISTAAVALVGMLWLLLFPGCSHEHESKPRGTASEQFLPAQELRLVDAAGTDFGTLQVDTDGVIVLWLFTSADLTREDAEKVLKSSEYRTLSTQRKAQVFARLSERSNAGSTLMFTSGSSGSLLTLFGEHRGESHRGSIDVLLEPLPSFMVHMPDGRHIDSQSIGWERSTARGIVAALFRVGRQSLFPPKPEHTLATELPSEDVRYVDKTGHVMLVCGLSQDADPSIAVLRTDGNLAAVLDLRELRPSNLGSAKEWPELWLFDAHGKIRFLVGPSERGGQMVTVYEDTSPDASDHGTYTLDAKSGLEIPVKKPFLEVEGAIPWLQKMPRVKPPIMLIDNRNRLLWKSPAQ